MVTGRLKPGWTTASRRSTTVAGGLVSANATCKLSDRQRQSLLEFKAGSGRGRGVTPLYVKL